MLTFLPGGYFWFAVAGAVFAAGPVIIHLLNRRRFRVVEWAAMDFLKEAVQRNRRILEMRDLILMILRALAILLFGLALAQPFVPAASVVSWQWVLPLAISGVIGLGLAGAALLAGRRHRNESESGSKNENKEGAA